VKKIKKEPVPFEPDRQLTDVEALRKKALIHYAADDTIDVGLFTKIIDRLIDAVREEK
jgi:hypothetical protein